MLEAEIFRDAHQHQDLVFAVAVRVHLELAVHDVDQRLEAQVATRHERGLVVLHRCVVVRPALLCSPAPC